MPKYKKVNEGIIGNFIEKLFTKVGEKGASKSLSKLAKKDPEFAKDYQVLIDLRKKMDIRLNSKAKKNAELQRIIKQYS